MIDPAKYSTADLERFALAPRSRQEAIAIREELRHRSASRPDTGTLSLFGRGENVQRPTPNAQSRITEAGLIAFSTFYLLLSTSGGTTLA